VRVALLINDSFKPNSFLTQSENDNHQLIRKIRLGSWGGWFSTKGKKTKIRVLKTDHRWKRKERRMERKKGINKINNDSFKDPVFELRP